ncbi:transposase [Azospirillum thiophilum]|uniref:Transposase n=1 Tax=Azospirillum thiophilum TaxID=528244 RepID=A0A0F2KVN9_9PROT|nr:transposase [Azospirillum thiophilum]ALG70970.1 transposase [Azospirillum thiophilum]ALG74793.1 transposase [Azospirillum thiophilum]KJR61617.1 transposase [Azospirillum thiophilum]KJR65367.1 transposase [Azospirillum thiophilum]
MAYQRVEVLTGRERRRSYTPAEKVRMVEEAFRPGVVVTEAARRLGVHESLLYRWRDLMKVGGTSVAEPPSFVAVTITPEPSVTEPPVVAPSEPLPLSATPATCPAVVEVILPSGARLRLEGAVDPALAAAVVGALA